MSEQANETDLGGYTWLKIHIAEDYDKLSDILEVEYGPKKIAVDLKKNISGEVGALLVEHDYIDKDYRSTFYNYYAKMGRPYRSVCVRIHFFDREVEYCDSPINLKGPDDWLDYRYFGYVVLRPTIEHTLGRSVLSPRIRIGARGNVIQSQHKVHLIGQTLMARGFPSMSQPADIAVCAHVSCWAILRHYSEQYSQPQELLVHDVTRLAKPFDPGGLTPSLGLTVYEAERIFQAAGCYPFMVVKNCEEDPSGDSQDTSFYAQLLSYLESGFPLFVALENEGHAIVIVGYSWLEPPCGMSGDNPHVWTQVEGLSAVDDNLLPYSTVIIGGEEVPGAVSPAYTARDFTAFIVPLPEKIYYPAHAVESFSRGALYRSYKAKLSLPDEIILLRRYFITTISALRRYVRKNRSQMGEELVSLFMHMRTAQFVWVIEYASEQQWAQEHIAARAVIDASASPTDEHPMWLCHNHELAIVFDRSSGKPSGKEVELDRPECTPLGRMEDNLRPVNW